MRENSSESNFPYKKQRLPPCLLQRRTGGNCRLILLRKVARLPTAPCDAMLTMALMPLVRFQWIPATLAQFYSFDDHSGGKTMCC